MGSKQTTTAQFNPAGMSTYNANQPLIQNALQYFLGGGGAGYDGTTGFGLAGNSGGDMFSPGSRGSRSAFEGFGSPMGGNYPKGKGSTSKASGSAGGFNPFTTPFFQAAFGLGNKSALQAGQNQMKNIGQMGGGFWGGGNQPGFVSALQRQAGMNTSALQQNAFWNALQQATGLEMGALNTASGFKPLQTGETISKSGLGTWLPQLAAMAAGAGMMLVPGMQGFGAGLIGSGASGLGGGGFIKGGSGSWNQDTPYTLPTTFPGYGSIPTSSAGLPGGDLGFLNPTTPPPGAMSVGGSGGGLLGF